MCWVILGFIGYRNKAVKGVGKAAQHSVHPTGGSLRVFRHFAWLEVGSGKMALSRSAHQRVTQTVGRSLAKVTKINRERCSRHKRNPSRPLKIIR
jgi:hypothetical protein